jgi:hypothetical protein
LRECAQQPERPATLRKTGFMRRGLRVHIHQANQQ